MKRWTVGLILSCCFSLVSCVGTVQETASNITDIGTDYIPEVVFNGVHTASGISDSKVELFFYPAGGGSGKYIYDIYVGSNDIPFSVPSDVLTPDYRGFLKYTVVGLQRLNTYNFSIQVRDQITNGKSRNVVIKKATTFANPVADFLGISSVANMPGQDGKDSILVRFTPATHSGALGEDKEWDPIRYEIVAVDADRLTPNDMDENLTTSEGRWFFSILYDKDVVINQYVVKGLLPKRKYYVRVRAIHKDSVEDIYNPHLRSELNTNYMEISTLSDDLADIKYDGSSFNVSILPGSGGLNSIQATWSQVEGVFDHFRLYYSKKNGGVSSGSIPPVCLSETQDPDASAFCKKAHYLATTTQITGLTPYTEYEFMLVICQTTECLPHQRIQAPSIPIRYATTDPATIFNGITEVEASNHLDGSQKIVLYYQDPNIIGGYFDGLILKMRRTLDGSDGEVTIDEFTSPIFHRPYNPMSTTAIEVEGIDYLSDQPYCFRLYPYKWNEDGSAIREIENENWKCIAPKIEPPTAEDFPGIRSGSTRSEYVTLRWDHPTSGFFTNYVVFFRTGLTFNWGEAIAAFNGTINDYDYFVVDGSDTSFSISSLPTGQYVFGVLTYHLYISDTNIVEKWSDTNTRFLKCNVENNSNLNVECNF